jgi:hypothetical protein
MGMSRRKEQRGDRSTQSHADDDLVAFEVIRAVEPDVLDVALKPPPDLGEFRICREVPGQQHLHR